MKTIYLVRHAEALQGDPGLDDSERRLAKKGRKDSKLMGMELKKSRNVAKLLISSPAARAIETAGIFAEQFSYSPNKIMIKNPVYEADAAGIIAMLQKLNDKYDSVMVFGHNPTISEAAKALTKQFAGSLSKTEVVCITVNRNKWRNVIRKQGVLVFRKTIQDVSLMKDMYRNMREEVQAGLSQIIKDYLSSKKLPIPDRLESRIHAMCKSVSKEAVKAFRNVKAGQ